MRILSRRTYRCDFLYETTARGREHNERHYADADLGVRLYPIVRWRRVSGDVRSVGAQRPVGHGDHLAAPRAEFNDGSLDVVLVRVTNRKNMLKLISISTLGAHVSNRAVAYLKVKSFELIPASPDDRSTTTTTTTTTDTASSSSTASLFFPPPALRPPRPRFKARGGVSHRRRRRTRGVPRGPSLEVRPPSLRRRPRPVSRLRPSSDRLNTIHTTRRAPRSPVPETLGPDRPSGTSVVDHRARTDARVDATRLERPTRENALDSTRRRIATMSANETTANANERDRDAGGGCGWKPGDKVKKAMKKAAAAAEKARVKAERAAALAAKMEAMASAPDPLAHRYGDAEMVQSKEKTGGGVDAGGRALDASFVNREVLIRGRIHNVRGKGKSAFIVLRQQTATVQVTMFVDDVHVSKGMVEWRARSPRRAWWILRVWSSSRRFPWSRARRTRSRLCAERFSACRDRIRNCRF